ncbi:MAG: sopA 4 [Solimicrobium sp.]|nr:sopA 4 [Solimicrobium sp.]
MIRPYSSLTPSPLNNSSIWANKPADGGVSRDTLKAVFDSINLLGLDEIVCLCQQKREKGINPGEIVGFPISTVNRENLDLNTRLNVNWLLTLDNQSIIEIENALQALRSKEKVILAAFKIGANRNQEEVIFSSDLNPGGSYKILVRAGVVYLKTVAQEIQLMSFPQWLTRSGPSWRTALDLTNLDLSGVDLTDAILTGANLTGTRLNNTILNGADLSGAILVKTVLRGASFRGTNLSSVNLKMADLSDLDFSGAKLIEATLNGACLKKANLSGANLSKAILESANLSGANLSKAILQSVDMRQAKLKKLQNPKLPQANLSEADLSHANLMGIDLRGMNLSGVLLRGVNLSSSCLTDVDLSGAELSGADLRKTDLQRANLNNTNLSKANLGEVDLSNGELSGAKLTSAILYKTILTGADLSGADLSDTNLSGKNLNGTNLYSAILRDVNLMGVKFDSFTNLQNTEISLKLPAVWNQDTLDQYFNHVNNTSTGSLLTVISNINDTFISSTEKIIKIELMHQIIDSLKSATISRINLAFIDIFMKNEMYHQDSKILIFIKERLLRSIITEANTTVLKKYNSALLRFFLEIVQAINKSDQEDQPGKFMLGNNGFFIQLIGLCTGHRDGEIKRTAEQLYDTYLELDQLKIYKEVHLKQVNYIEGGIRNIDENDLAYVFISKNKNTGVYGGLLLSKKNIADMLHQGTDHDWTTTYFVENDQAVSSPNLTEVYEMFPLFNPAYQFQLHRATFAKLLKTINLKYINQNNELGVITKDYNSLFEDALKVSALKGDRIENLTGSADQNTLRKIFEPLFSRKPYRQFNKNVRTNAKTLTDIHYNQIINTFFLSNSGDLTKARTLFCLATLFAKYSSSHFFGTESDSPTPLREYAAALLIKAYELDSSIFKDNNNTAEANFVVWITKMVGGTIIATGKIAEFTCTAVLSGILIDHANKHEDFKKIVNRMKPPGW